MNYDEQKMHYALIKLTKGFTHDDFFAYRKERSWEKYNSSNPIERLQMIMKEIYAYKKGYSEDSGSNERDYGDSTDEIY